MIENTHNRGGGIIFPTSETRAICEAARSLGVKSYLDGARLFNVSVATGESLASLADSFDLVSVSLSKGLGCPIGSVMAGPRDVIARAVRFRRMMGGGMRQTGIVAAAGLYALKHNMARMAEDHANALAMAKRIQGVDGVELHLSTVQTNIIIFKVLPPLPEADPIVAKCAERGVMISAFGRRTVRVTTHLDVDPKACCKAADVIVDVLSGK